MIADKIIELIADFIVNNKRQPTTLILNQEHKMELFTSTDFYRAVSFDGDHYPKRIMGLLYDVQDVREMSLK